MQNFEIGLKLDPWALSSLLQKAIRRGEAELAQYAGRELYRYRGKGVFRRLANIAFEDVGIADPELVWEAMFLMADGQARALLGSDVDLILDLSAKLAAATKDRSTDYLVCSVLKTEAGTEELTRVKGLRPEQQLAVTIDLDQPILRRAAAALATCATDDVIEVGPTLLSLLRSLETAFPTALHAAVELAAKHKFGAYVLMAPILWSSLQHGGGSRGAVNDSVPAAENLKGLPLYTFDKHTSAGKRAIARFADANPEARRRLAKAVPAHLRNKAAYMTAFYADAIPITRRLDWPSSIRLQNMGMEADLGSVGAQGESAIELIECFRTNLAELNFERRKAVLGPLSRFGGKL